MQIRPWNLLNVFSVVTALLVVVILGLEYSELNKRKIRISCMIADLKVDQNRYFNIKKLNIPTSMNSALLYRIDSIRRKFNSKSLVDEFNYTNQSRRLYYDLSRTNYEYTHSCWLGFGIKYIFKNLHFDNKYYFGYEDRLPVPCNSTYRTTINGISGNYNDLPYSDTLNIEMLNLTVSYETGEIETIKANCSIVIKDALKNIEAEIR